MAAGIKGRHRFPWEASRPTLSTLLSASQERVPVPPAIPEAPSPAHTYNCKVSAGSNACDDVGGDALPLAMVVLAKGADLQGAAGQRVVLAPAGLPYLGQGARGARQREKNHDSEARQARQGSNAMTELSARPMGHHQALEGLPSLCLLQSPCFQYDLAQ